MTLTQADLEALDELEYHIKAILPEVYQDTYDDVQPVPMRSAGLIYDVDGKVAWDEIWESFCDLAMAGGPPHKGTLLEPGARAEIAAQPDRYREVTDEVCRGIEMATELPAEASPTQGWVRAYCTSPGMAGWLARAIVMENVAARSVGTALDLPAAPAFRLEKEIKNVVTVVAKTSHYWKGHMPSLQQRSIGSMFSRMAKTTPLIEPAYVGDAFWADKHEFDCTEVADRVYAATGLRRSNHRTVGWIGLECGKVGATIWMMRALVVGNIMSRREGTTLMVPVNAATDPSGERVVTAVAQVHRLAAARRREPL
ncbi:MAG: hypothetical protein ABMA15_21650 [Vicinamibacterales bacterium]